MKKFLVILMVIAMASFLFVGCLGDGVTPPVDDEDEDDVTPPATVAPVITSVPDIVGGYVNAVRAADGIVVNGTAPTLSEVKVYINGICAGTGDVTATGFWTVDVANADLIKAVKVEGAKTLHATATDLGLPESASSNVFNFILDTITPFIASSSAKAGTGIVYSFVETADSMSVAGAGAPDSTLALFTERLVNTDGTIDAPAGVEWVSMPAGSFALPAVTTLGEQILAPFATIPAAAINRLLPGVVDWKIEVIAFGVNDTTVTIRVTNLTAVTSQDYTFDNSQGAATSTSWIQGISVTGPAMYSSLTDVGAWVLITTTNTAASAGFVDVTFNEAVTGASITAAGTTWTLFGATAAIANTVSVRSATVARLTEDVAGSLVAGVIYSVSASGIADLAGNTIPDTAPSWDGGVVIP